MIPLVPPGDSSAVIETTDLNRRPRVLKDTQFARKTSRFCNQSPLFCPHNSLPLKFSIADSPLSDENVEDTPQRAAHLLFPLRASGALPRRRKHTCYRCFNCVSIQVMTGSDSDTCPLPLSVVGDDTVISERSRPSEDVQSQCRCYFSTVYDEMCTKDTKSVLTALSVYMMIRSASRTLVAKSNASTQANSSMWPILYDAYNRLC
jgi:hypothetical protein